MKPAIIALGLLCLVPMTGFCQATTQTQFNVPPGVVQQVDTATYQDPSAPAPVPPSGSAVTAPGTPPIPGQIQPVVAPTGPGTAQEQGYDPDLARMQQQMRREAEDYAAMNTARQLGQVISAPGLHNSAAKDPSSRAWIQDWATVLSGVGIPASKVYFEAARLTREDFAMWASRMVWAYGTPAQVRQMECCSP